MPVASNSVRRARPLLGTFVEIEASGATEARMNAGIDAAFAATAVVHGLMSFHESGSDVGRLNRLAGARPVRVHAWTWQVLKIAAELHRRSAGLFDVTVASVLQDLKLLPGDPHGQGSGVTNNAAGIDLLPDRYVRFRHLDMRIDLGGIAKGFAVDRALDVLCRHGMDTGLINAGGDISVFGSDPRMIDLRNPRDPRHVICRIPLKDAGLASSGAYFDLFDATEPGGTAIIDPRTRQVVQRFPGATVRAHSCMIADALTKIVMIAGRDAAPLLAHYGADAIMVLPDGALEMTCGFENALAA